MIRGVFKNCFHDLITLCILNHHACLHAYTHTHTHTRTRTRTHTHTPFYSLRSHTIPSSYSSFICLHKQSSVSFSVVIRLPISPPTTELIPSHVAVQSLPQAAQLRSTLPFPPPLQYGVERLTQPFCQGRFIPSPFAALDQGLCASVICLLKGEAFTLHQPALALPDRWLGTGSVNVALNI